MSEFMSLLVWFDGDCSPDVLVIKKTDCEKIKEFINEAIGLWYSSDNPEEEFDEENVYNFYISFLEQHGIEFTMCSSSISI